MEKIGFIGMGNMGSAILNGLLRVYKPEDLLFTAAHKEKMEAVTAKTGVPHAVSNAECVKKSEYVILAVKPQYFETVFIKGRSDRYLTGTWPDHCKPYRTFRRKGAYSAYHAKYTGTVR